MQTYQVQQEKGLQRQKYGSVSQPAASQEEGLRVREARRSQIVNSFKQARSETLANFFKRVTESVGHDWAIWYLATEWRKLKKKKEPRGVLHCSDHPDTSLIHTESLEKNRSPLLSLVLIIWHWFCWAMSKRTSCSYWNQTSGTASLKKEKNTMMPAPASWFPLSKDPRLSPQRGHSRTISTCYEKQLFVKKRKGNM